MVSVDAGRCEVLCFSQMKRLVSLRLRLRLRPAVRVRCRRLGFPVISRQLGSDTFPRTPLYSRIRNYGGVGDKVIKRRSEHQHQTKD